MSDDSTYEIIIDGYDYCPLTFTVAFKCESLVKQSAMRDLYYWCCSQFPQESWDARVSTGPVYDHVVFFLQSSKLKRRLELYASLCDLPYLEHNYFIRGSDAQQG